MKKTYKNTKYSKKLTEEYLIQEYSIKENYQSKIAKEVGCDSSDVKRYLKKYNIKIRTRSEAKSKWNKTLTKKYLIKEYSIKEKSTNYIAKMIGCSCSTVYHYLKKYNIKIRSKGELIKGKNHWCYGKKGKNNPGWKGDKALVRQTYYCKEENCINKIGYENWKFGKGRCSSCAAKLKWLDKEFREKQIKASFEGRKISPNKPEKTLIKLLNKILPKQYKFVGDGKLIVGGFIPDFVNKDNNKIIEHYGDYWHNTATWKKRDNRRTIAYNKLGYKTLIIWEHELKDINKVKNRILEFNKND